MLKKIYSILILSIFILASCQEENEVDNSLRVAFQEFGGNITSESEEANVMVLSSKPAESNITVQLSVAAACGALLDEFQLLDATGAPIQLTDGGFSIDIAQGSSNNFFTVQPIEGQFPVGSVDLDFFIEEVSNADINDTHLNYNLRVGTGAGFFPESVDWGFDDQSGQRPSQFTAYNEAGFISDRSIRLGSESVGGETNRYLRANAFGGDGTEIDTWLISNRRFDFRSADLAEFILDVKYKIEGDGKIEFLWSDNYCGTGAPTDASWNNLEMLESQIPTIESNNYTTLSQEVNDVLGTSVHFAIRFVEATADSSAEYAIDNIRINALTSTGGGGGEGDENSLATDFEGCSEDFAIPTGFNQEHTSAKTDRGWGCRGFGIDDSRSIQASAFSGEAGEVDAWLITFESFDFASLSEVNVQMQLYSNFAGPGQIEMLYSEDYAGSGSPSDATWTSVDQVNDLIPAAGSQEWTPVDVDVADLGGKEVYFAFRFSGASDEASSSWAIDNLAINDADAFDGTGGGGTGGGEGGGTDGLSYSTDFEECSNDFAVPQNFTQVHTSDKTDRGWGCRAFGLEDSRGVQASAFGGEEGEVNAWLITSSTFDFSELSEVNLQMQLYSNFDGPGEIELKYSEDYDGSGDPENATWVSISAVNNSMPTAGSQEWVPINENISELGGKEVYFAFHFFGGNAGGSSSWTIDNLAINDPDAF